MENFVPRPRGASFWNMIKIVDKWKTRIQLLGKPLSEFFYFKKYLVQNLNDIIPGSNKQNPIIMLPKFAKCAQNEK